MTNPEPAPEPDNRHAIAADVVSTMIAMAQAIGPHQFRAWLHGAIIAGFLVHVPDDFWNEMSKIRECGQPKCKCHIQSQELHHALDLVRTQYKARAKKLDNTKN